MAITYISIISFQLNPRSILINMYKLIKINFKLATVYESTQIDFTVMFIWKIVLPTK